MITSMKLTGTPEALALYHSGEENYYYKQGTENNLTPDLKHTAQDSAQSLDYVRVHGQLCPDLGLEAGQSIDEATFTNLLHGRNAMGEKVTQKHRVHGIDLTFSAPKTVSIAGLVTDRDPAITQAHDSAVLETMREIEAQHSFCRPTSTTKVETGRMVYVAVRDGLSREHDPHLHTHAIVMNITKGPKATDKIMGIHTSEIIAVEFNKVWGAVYRAKLAGKMKELGYSITYTKQGMWRLDKVSPELEREFSQRHQDIVKAKSKGKLDMTAWRSTRRDKMPDSWHQGILNFWESRQKHYNDRGVVANRQRTLQDRQEWTEQAVWSMEARQEKETARQRTTEAQKWQLAARRATQHTATISRKELITEYLTELARAEKWKPVTYIECEERLREQIKQGNLVQTQEDRITSWEMMTADRKAVNTEQNDKRATQDLGLTETNITKHLNTYQKQQQEQGRQKLSEVQQQAVKKILLNTSPVTVVQGDAGSGKTTALRAVSEICREQNINVIGLAMQGVAARNLEQESGIKSQTLASYLSQDTQYAERNTLVIVDEASMLDSRNTAKLMEITAQNGNRLILVGDRNQLESIGAGRPFDRLVENAEQENTLISMNENYRQQDPVLRQAVEYARNGKMVQSLELLDKNENIKEISDNAERRKEIANQYSPETLIITGTVQARDELNEQIRATLVESGKLNDRQGRTYIMTPPDYEGMEVQRAVRLAPGDRITFMRNEYRNYDIRNGERATVTAVGERNLEVLTADGRKLDIDTREYRAIDHGYALTTFKAQGQTYNKVIVESDTQIPSLNDMRNQYVQITRARNKVTIYTDDREALKELAELKSHSRDTLDEKVTLKQAEQNQKATEQRVGLYIKDSIALDPRLTARDEEQAIPHKHKEVEHRKCIVNNAEFLNSMSPADWLRARTEQAMLKTQDRLNERTDLTPEQKRKSEGVLNGQAGREIWNKQSLTPDGRIATALSLAGDRNAEQLIQTLPTPEQGVVRAVERKARQRERGRGFSR